jgi:hypothetical protein
MGYTMLDDLQPKPPFSAEELRVLGCLMEKQLTTPNNYPLTLNSLVLACNQKSSREPVMNLAEGKVGHIVRDLHETGWVILQNSERAQRIEHKAQRQLKLNQKQQALLAVLLLRRPQTLNELKARTERMAEFSGTDEIRTILDAWLGDEKPLVMCLPASAGRREDRYFHTLGEERLEDLQEEPGTAASEKPAARHDCCAELEVRIAELERRLTALESR